MRGCHEFDDTFFRTDLYISLAKMIYEKTEIYVGRGRTCFCENNLCPHHQWDTLIEASSYKDIVSASVTPISRSTNNGDDPENTMTTINDEKNRCGDYDLIHILNPLTAGVAYIRVFIFY